jgi:hypothetical protein
MAHMSEVTAFALQHCTLLLDDMLACGRRRET